MHRKLIIALEVAGTEQANAMRNVRCDTDGEIVDGKAVNEWVHQQVKIWELGGECTITVKFETPLPPDEFSKV